MLILIHFKKEFLYIIYFIPLCLFKLIFKFGIKKQTLISSTESFSKILLIMLYFYQIIRYRKESIELFIKNQNSHKKNTFILLSIIYFIISLYLDKFNLNNLNDIDDNLSIFLIDLIFFKKQIYSHHILSCILNIISFSIIFFNYNIYKSLNLFIIFIIKNYCNSFSMLLVKYINTVYFTNIYLLGSLIGLFSFLYQIFNLCISDFNKVLIIYLIICFILDIFFYYIILKFNPIYVIICYHLSYILIDFLTKNTPFNLFELIILYIFEIISCLIYLEIIELNFLGLNKNIKKNIILRSSIENDEIINKNKKLSNLYLNTI